MVIWIKRRKIQQKSSKQGNQTTYALTSIAQSVVHFLAIISQKNCVYPRDEGCSYQEKEYLDPDTSPHKVEEIYKYMLLCMEHDLTKYASFPIFTCRCGGKKEETFLYVHGLPLVFELSVLLAEVLGKKSCWNWLADGVLILKIMFDQQTIVSKWIMTYILCSNYKVLNLIKLQI